MKVEGKFEKKSQSNWLFKKQHLHSIDNLESTRVRVITIDENEVIIQY